MMTMVCRQSKYCSVTQQRDQLCIVLDSRVDSRVLVVVDSFRMVRCSWPLWRYGALYGHHITVARWCSVWVLCHMF